MSVADYVLCASVGAFVGAVVFRVTLAKLRLREREACFQSCVRKAAEIRAEIERARGATFTKKCYLPRPESQIAKYRADTPPACPRQPSIPPDEPAP
jgi:hypothetical protein